MVSHDTNLATAARFTFHPGGFTPKFQFPPTCSSDVKEANFKTYNQMATEPGAMSWGQEARKLTVQTKYIVDGDWTPEKIAAEVRGMKGAYFYKGDETSVRYVQVTFYRISDQAGTYRMTSFAMEYEGPYIGKGDDAWPLVTNITLTLQFYSQLKGTQAVSAPLTNDPSTNPGWY
ncbi:MAG: hypothetical protein Q8K86_08300 [Candidatus Nanopelagicaceae bacterium]|nr:hypothetical protein [Candidatus Nanopelagicaceae bacterium]